MILLLTAAAVYGCGEPEAPGPSALRTAEVLRAAQAAYSRGDDEEVVARMDRLLRDGDARPNPEALYLRGLARYRLARRVSVGEGTPGPGQARSLRAAARRDFERALERTGHPSVRAKALTCLGDLAYDAGATTKAEEHYRDALGLAASNSPAAAHARYRLGCALQRQGRWNEADVQFDRLLWSPPAEEAEGGQGRDDPPPAHAPARAVPPPIAELAARRTHAVAWTVQVGAFRDAERARNEARRLRREGQDAVVRPGDANGRPVFRVQVGSYRTYTEAAETRAKLVGGARDSGGRDPLADPPIVRAGVLTVVRGAPTELADVPSPG